MLGSRVVELRGTVRTVPCMVSRAEHSELGFSPPRTYSNYNSAFRSIVKGGYYLGEL